MNAWMRSLSEIMRLDLDLNRPRVRLKAVMPRCVLMLWLMLLFAVVVANRPPRFLIDGQSEIVVRLKEGTDTPVGMYYQVH